ncbi:MAG: glycosyltransferase family 2 protein, partial [Atopobiaceae bacterium]|nr:glycosyltransferase family 2 protein [Atopobiaceae bacterium]
MEFNGVGLTPIVVINLIVWLIFTLAYLYQAVYMVWVLLKGMVKLPPAKKNHTYAFVIAAHNEEPVIGNLVRSILTQDYDGEIGCFVVADNCTDTTAELAEQAGAVAWRRDDLVRKGKSWALDYAFARILDEYGDKYEAFIVMDADNILAPNYLKIMNDAFDEG